MRHLFRRSPASLPLLVLLLIAVCGSGGATSLGASDAGWFSTLSGVATPADLPAVTPAVTRATTSSSPCGAMNTATSTVPITHVVWVVFENKTSDMFTRAGTTDAPYLTSLATGCGQSQAYSATPYDASKLAMTSGTNWGVTSDAAPEPGPDLYSQLGTSWLQYMGGMDSNCRQTNDGNDYYVRHNAAFYYTDAAAACATQDVPLPTDPTLIDISQPFTWIEGDVRDSMHVCPAPTCQQTSLLQMKDGDDWASSVIPALIATPQYQSGSTVIFVVWDQGTKTDSGAPFIVVSPYVAPGTVSAVPISHYSLLRGTEEYLGLSLLQHAADSTTTSVAGMFGLPTAPGAVGTDPPPLSSRIVPPVITGP